MSYFNEIKIKDGYGFKTECTQADELRVAISHRLVGGTYEGATLDTKYWTNTNTVSGSGATANGILTLSTGTNSAATAVCQSVRNARYIGSAGNRYRGQIQLNNTGTTSNIRQWGCYSATDGAFYQLSGTSLNIVTRLNSVDTVVNSASWNGDTTIPVLTNVNTYEIYYMNTKVYFTSGGVLKHTLSCTTSPWSATKNLPVRLETLNQGSTTNNTISSWVNTIVRLGDLETQSISFYQTGQTTSVLKLGAGTLHRVLIGGVATNAALTIYDNTSAAGTIIYSTGAMPNGTNPFSLDFDNLPFFTGLTVSTTSANANVTIIYE